ncbi:hypothetical protein H6G33_10685 [Calothrix sp. FACHB-1219]|uniref:hypothetical protein n=1 Tax=unclassified Calothrix TaxID=2619626 RepID=UPI00168A0B9C|nr:MULTISPECIES: hypothetical protein [unclassified Calothrix]MBD2201814.1 hypothetical protein [Calothrix sp. FACHB-168]MBD2217500.1 hypothetical protein [Calothrix sp. FACHB-1219]
MTDLYDKVGFTLSKRFPNLIQSFGNLNNFLSLVIYKELDPSIYIHRILNHPDKIVVITPTDLSFNITEGDNSFRESSSINLDHPYSVYDKDGLLLYKVSNHSGVYGNSILDRTLVLQSKVLDYYYLQYDTYSSTKTLLILIGLYSVGINKLLFNKDKDYSANRVSTLEDQSLITINVSSLERDVSKEGTPFYPLRVHTLRSSPSLIPNREQLLINGATSEEDYDLDITDYFFLYPISSGFYSFSQVKGNLIIPVAPSLIDGEGSNRFILSSPYVYYLGMHKDINIDILRQAFNLLDIEDLPGVELDKRINLTLTF